MTYTEYVIATMAFVAKEIEGKEVEREVLPKDPEAMNPNNQNLEDNECDEKVTAWI